MDDTLSFGSWIRRRRKALDLTQERLAQRVGCSLGAIRKLESDERRPSPEMAERLAAILDLVDEARVAFLKVARAERAADYLVAPAEQVDHVASLLARWSGYVPGCGNPADWAGIRGGNGAVYP